MISVSELELYAMHPYAWSRWAPTKLQALQFEDYPVAIGHHHQVGWFALKLEEESKEKTVLYNENGLEFESVHAPENPAATGRKFATAALPEEYKPPNAAGKKILSKLAMQEILNVPAAALNAEVGSISRGVFGNYGIRFERISEDLYQIMVIQRITEPPKTPA